MSRNELGFKREISRLSDDPILNESNEIQVMLMSWNMGNARPPDFSSILPEDKSDYHIIVFGFQEATWSVKSEDAEASAESCFQQLMADLQNSLTHEYDLVAHNRRVQMQIFVFAKVEMRGRIKNVERNAENTGFLHVFPNKGGLRIGITVDSTKLSFISVHLTAHEGVSNCQLRNYSVEEILMGVNGEKEMTTHHTFFMGDMNYRTTFNKNVPTKRKVNKGEELEQQKNPTLRKNKSSLDLVDDNDEEEEDNVEGLGDREKEKLAIFEMIRGQKWTDLLELDELNREIAAGRVLCNFKATQPSFPPTFKRIRNMILKDSYFMDVDKDLSVLRTYYDEKRLPSFTDRILTYSLPGFEHLLRLLSFQSNEFAASSDHKPVFGKFNLQTVNGLKDIKKYSSRSINHSHLPVYTDKTVYRLKNLRAFNLSEMDSQLFGGGSDPYVVLSSDPPELLLGDPAKFRTKHISHNLNPVWDETIDFKLVTNDIDGLCRNGHLFLTVWDYDMTNDDDLIGGMIIALDTLFNHYNATRGHDFPFSTDLIRHGLVHGRIEGSIEIMNSMQASHDNHDGSLHGDIETLHDLFNHEGKGAQRNSVKFTPANAGCNCMIS